LFSISSDVIATTAQDENSSISIEKDRETTVPLNLSSGLAEDKRAKRPINDAETADLAKRVKTEQTEATDLSMKSSSSGSSQNRLGNHSVWTF
jgi:septal ring-binding cell division protein DamX